MVNTTLAMGHQSRPCALLKISHSHMVFSTPNEYKMILLFWLGKTIPPGSIPGDTCRHLPYSIFYSLIKFIAKWKQIGAKCLLFLDITEKWSSTLGIVIRNREWRLEPTLGWKLSTLNWWRCSGVESRIHSEVSFPPGKLTSVQYSYF